MIAKEVNAQMRIQKIRPHCVKIIQIPWPKFCFFPNHKMNKDLCNDFLNGCF